MQVKTFHAKNLVELTEMVTSATSTGFVPTLSIVFTSSDTPLEELTGFFREQHIAMVGCTTAGEIRNTESYEKTTVAMLFDCDPSAFELIFDVHEEKDVFACAERFGREAAQKFVEPGLLFLSGGMNVDAEVMTFGLKSGFGEKNLFYGALAGDDLQISKTFSFTHEQISSNGLAGIVFDSKKIAIKGLAVSGWEAIGGEMTITHAVGNVVHTINDEPALDVFVKYFGFFDDAQRAKISTMSAQYPFQVQRGDGTSVLRSPIFGSEIDGSIQLLGGVKTGDKFKFSIAPGFEVLDQTVQEFEKFKQVSKSPDALILFSCKGRQAAFGPMIEDEIRGIYNHWKKPMIGFFSYGEIGQIEHGSCDFHNETCCLVTLTEVNSAPKI